MFFKLTFQTIQCFLKNFVSLVTSLMYLIERLQVISSQLGLKFTPNDPSFTDILISSLMFAVRLLLTPEGGVRDVQIAHSSEARASVVRISLVFVCFERGTVKMYFLSVFDLLVWDWFEPPLALSWQFYLGHLYKFWLVEQHDLISLRTSSDLLFFPNLLTLSG